MVHGCEICWKNLKNGWKFLEDDPRCPKCDMSVKDIEEDPCLGHLPGVSFACCGHGNQEKAYIVFENGVKISGFTVDDIKSR